MVISLLKRIFNRRKLSEVPSVIPTEQERTIKKFLVDREIERLTTQQMEEISQTFSNHLHAGIEGKPSSLAMLPSGLTVKKLTAKHLGEKALVVEMGGTNLYAGEVVIKKEEEEIQPVIINSVSRPYSSLTKHFESADDFFEEASPVAKEVSVGTIDALGIIWSFPGNVRENDKGVDQQALSLDKGFIVPDIENGLVGEKLIAALQRDGVSIGATIPRAVLNDTVAVLLAGNGKIGGVIGTGVNFAVEYSGQIYNVEAGGFSQMPETALTKAIDALDHPGTQLAEKQISGKYIGMQLDTIVNWMIEEGLLAGFTKHESLNAEHLSTLLSGDKERIAKILIGITDESFAILVEIAQILRDRSAQIAGTIIGTLVNEIADQLPDDVIIPIEGSFFEKTPRYQDVVALATQAILHEDVIKSKHIVFKQVSQSGIKGAAVAALTVND